VALEKQILDRVAESFAAALEFGLGTPRRAGLCFAGAGEVAEISTAVGGECGC
jgi:hypothetical protein